MISAVIPGIIISNICVNIFGIHFQKIKSCERKIPLPNLKLRYQVQSPELREILIFPIEKLIIKLLTCRERRESQLLSELNLSHFSVFIL
jgi:hypothetical protein